MPDAYFSATKIRWILDNVEGAREMADAGALMCGTIDTWLIYNLTHGLVHATDYTNASRTMLFDIKKLDWDDELCNIVGVPRSMLPECRPSAGGFGRVSSDIMTQHPPIAGVAGDQQASLFGHCCFEPGNVKNTYGTGCFMLMNVGTEPIFSQNGLVTTVGIADGTEVDYALEGSVFQAGSTIQWIRDELGLVETAAETSDIARSVPNTDGCYLVPAFTGLGAPWWNSDARGVVCGITRATNRARLVRAACESLAYQSYDVLKAMEADSGIAFLRSVQTEALRETNSSCNSRLICLILKLFVQNFPKQQRWAPPILRVWLRVSGQTEKSSKPSQRIQRYMCLVWSKRQESNFLQVGMRQFVEP